MSGQESIVDVPIPIKASALALPLNQVYSCIIDHNDNKSYHTTGQLVLYTYYDQGRICILSQWINKIVDN
jgi:hypothetical protein